MPSSFIRVLGFFTKEMNEVRRQPRLILSLLLGPFLILLLFGIGYRDESTALPTVLVVPPDLLNDPKVAALRERAGAIFNVVDVLTDEEEAMRRLARREVRLVEILPPDAEQRVREGQQAAIEFRFDELNPVEERAIRFASYLQVIELNTTLLTGAVAETQRTSTGELQLLADARTRLDILGQAIGATDTSGLRKVLAQARDAAAGLAASSVIASAAGTGGADRRAVQQQLSELARDLAALDQAAGLGRLAEERLRIDRTRRSLAELEVSAKTLAALPPAVLVSPLQDQAVNMAGPSLDIMTFYAPGVMALILQHIALTLAALALVREHLQGAMELFRVSPVTMGQVLLGKVLGFTLFVTILGGVLLGLMRLLGVPLIGSLGLWLALLLLFVIASLGVGFVVSALARTESQAVQLSMLVLLLSVFFSGFFLPLDSFIPAVRWVSYLLPLTYAIQGFQSIMLRGRPPEPAVWAGLATIAAVTYLWVRLRWGRHSLND